MTQRLPEALPGQNYVTLSAIAGGHITLPDYAFISPSEPEAKRHVPSLSFLITHPGIAASPSLIDVPTKKPLRVLFDLGLRQRADDYLQAQQKHLETRKPYELFPGVPEQLRINSIDLETIDLVILSHVHYDHHGDPELFQKSKFIVGPQALDVLKNGLAPELGSHQIFKADLLPLHRTIELPPVNDGDWKELGPFPRVIDLLNDGSMYVIDTPGHLPGHINLLCRLSEDRWVCLAGDAFHDKRLLTGEKEMGTWNDHEGRTLCIHLDRAEAEKSIERLRQLGHMGVEIIAAHDDRWEQVNDDKFLPGRL
ncbi:uncharacterized protein PV09_08536 [Verruconis gallopava]|uniref:Metallo-beta-lactamase domain-containing protein n=1 Tax=Verruconis gallopava TaxID=253628 RepID=A0A0D2ALB9_9PEZI|nr:uncharacterized protein PV09_08536 [Verruconis gallopava]KIV99868.1 hypothetical protein PV09_08536 [Verruconis gallopava]